MQTSITRRHRSGRHFGLLSALLTALTAACLLVACNSSDDDSTRTGSESHFVRCIETTDCDVGLCVDGFCEVNGERVRADSSDDNSTDPAGGDDETDDSANDGGSSGGSSVSEAGSASSGESLEAGGSTSSDDSAPDEPASDDPANDDPGSDDPADGPDDSSGSEPNADDDAGTSTDPEMEAGATPPGTTSMENEDPPAVVVERLTPCPDAAPTDGDTCDELGLECTYGTDPRGVRCRTRAVCTFGGWTVEEPPCSALVDLGECPMPSAELHGTACEPNAHCSNGAARCQCGDCYIESYEVCEGGLCNGISEVICGDTPVWHCDEQVQTGCPIDAPDIGAPCDDSEPYCYYFDPVCGEEIQTGCFLGRISALPPLGFGEDCDGQFVDPEEFCPAEPPEPQTACSRGFRDPPALACDYGACERYTCGGQIWQGGILNEPECTDCGLFGDACDEDSPCCNGFFCQAGACASSGWCGNDFVDPTETCDDGNLEDGDGCSSQCQLEVSAL